MAFPPSRPFFARFPLRPSLAPFIKTKQTLFFGLWLFFQESRRREKGKAGRSYLCFLFSLSLSLFLSRRFIALLISDAEFAYLPSSPPFFLLPPRFNLQTKSERDRSQRTKQQPPLLRAIPPLLLHAWRRPLPSSKKDRFFSLTL